MSCSTSHVTSEVSSDRFQVSGEREARDSLCEEISQNLNENLTEHEVVTETVIYNDSLKIDRIIERIRTLESGSRLQTQSSKVEVRTVRDTIYVERVDTVQVSSSKIQVPGNSLHSRPSSLNLLKWIFWIIIAIMGLIITLKVCLRRI